MCECQECIHERICAIWQSQECQNASCYVDDCFEPKLKTADEMFREMGFIRNTSICYNDTHILYEKDVMNGTDIESVEFKDGKWLFTTTFRTPMLTSGPITRAVYKKMQELGWLDEMGVE